MNNFFFPHIWRGDKNYYTKEIMEFPLGDMQLKLIQKKVLDNMENLIKGTFDYPDIIISQNTCDETIINNVMNELIENDGFSEYSFGVNLIDGNYSKVSIRKIPCCSENRYIEIYFQMIANYVMYVCKIIQQNIHRHKEHGYAFASGELAIIVDRLVYNLEKTVIVEYLYNVFNRYDEKYKEQQGMVEPPIRYDFDLLTRIIALAYELSFQKIENEEINVGFVFHDELDNLQNNCVKAIKLKEKIKLGDFKSIKHLLPISNGKNIFFNVTEGCITHIFITKNIVKEIYFKPLTNSKAFLDRPLIVSIQGSGKIIFLEGGNDKNKVLLEIANGRPKIRDIDFVQKHLLLHLESEIQTEKEKIKLFIDWVLSLAYQKHGASILIGNFDAKVKDKLIKQTTIEYPDEFLEDEKFYDLELLTSFIRPDGAVLFSRKLIPYYITTILPFTKVTKAPTGGARHNSSMNFTKENKCIGIVVSEDGPITLFKNGKKVITF